MTFVRKQTITPTTDASGNVVAYSTRVNGRISAIIYTADGTNPYSNTVDFTITTEDTGMNVWTESNISASKTVAPRMATHSTAGVAALYAAGGQAVNDQIAVANERIKFSLAQGGNTKTGSFVLIME